jgi:hypothetical protein
LQRGQAVFACSISCGSVCDFAIVPMSSSKAGPVTCAVSVKSNQTRSQCEQRSISTRRP